MTRLKGLVNIGLGQDPCQFLSVFMFQLMEYHSTESIELVDISSDMRKFVAFGLRFHS